MNRSSKWSPPLDGLFKINTDGSTQGNPGIFEIGGVGCDSRGSIQFLFSIYIGVHSNNQMEAWAILKALEKACELG